MLLGGCLTLSGQLSPDAAVIDFRLPVFADNGYRVWDLRGERGLLLDEDTIAVEGAELRVFEPVEEQPLQAVFTSPRALFRPDQQIAEGDGAILIESGTHRIEGKDWTWRGESSELEIREAVEVIYAGSLGNVLQ